MNWVPVKYLQECFTCDAENGTLAWKARPRAHFADFRAFSSVNARFAGNVAGVCTRSGYLEVQIGDQKIRAHRIIWAMHTGEWPIAFIDHKNGDRADNRISNLREANTAQNCANRGASPKNKVGLKGVSPHGERFRAQIKTRDRVILLGVFDTPELAHAAYAEAAVKCHGEFAGGLCA